MAKTYTYIGDAIGMGITSVDQMAGFNYLPGGSWSDEYNAVQNGTATETGSDGGYIGIEAGAYIGDLTGYVNNEAGYLYMTLDTSQTDIPTGTMYIQFMEDGFTIGNYGVTNNYVTISQNHVTAAPGAPASPVTPSTSPATSPAGSGNTPAAPGGTGGPGGSGLVPGGNTGGNTSGINWLMYVLLAGGLLIALRENKKK